MKQKMNKLIRNSTLYAMPLDFVLNMHIFAALSGCPGVTSDRTRTGIRRTVSLHSEHVYKDTFWVETSINMNYCAIF